MGTEVHGPDVHRNDQSFLNIIWGSSFFIYIMQYNFTQQLKAEYEVFAQEQKVKSEETKKIEELAKNKKKAIKLPKPIPEPEFDSGL